jgi:hypothetical protein
VALSDLAVFSEQLYSTSTEVLRQQIDLFNAASNGAIVLQSAAHQGDFNEVAFFQKISGLVRRRNAYGSGAVSSKKLAHISDAMVKVAAGTPPVELDPGQFKWIQMNPEVAAAAMGQQLAIDTMADMLNTALTAGRVALSGQSAIIYDATADTVKTVNATALNNTAFKFGDRSGDIAVWVMHSKGMADFYGAAIANAANLFKYGTINVVSDPFGRLFVVTDAPGLVVAGTPNVYYTLGLAPGGLEVHQNNDYTDNIQTTNGDENIKRTFQAEWSYQLGIKGFTWDKTNGGKSPNDAALATATNWDKIVTDNKDLAGVLLKSN